MTAFSWVEIILALIGIHVIFWQDELRLFGKVLRGSYVALVGLLLLTPLPFAVAIGFYSGAAAEIARTAQGKTWAALYEECCAKLWWLDPAGIAVSAVLIVLTFLLCGKSDAGPDWDNRLARDGWRDPVGWERLAREQSAGEGEGQPPGAV